MDAITFIAEQRIREAQEKGAFDQLPGAGRPLQLEDDSHVPADLRMAYKILRNSGYAPPEIEDRKEALTLLHFLEQCDDEQEKVRQMRRLDVVMERIARQRGFPPLVSEKSPYYAHLVERAGGKD